ncbi:hypothetical protein FACS1894172_17250 [Spirochaetia bacterium]|nr:hypothetical protein FACS1894172_17250 [Spirochaetia bacterium]
MKLLYTFKTIGAALDAEQIFKKAKLPCRAIPMPRVLGTSCTYAVILESDRIPVTAVEYEKVFHYTGNTYEEII